MNGRAPWPANSWVSRVTNWIGEEWVCEQESFMRKKYVGDNDGDVITRQESVTERLLMHRMRRVGLLSQPTRLSVVRIDVK